MQLQNISYVSIGIQNSTIPCELLIVVDDF